MVSHHHWWHPNVDGCKYTRPHVREGPTPLIPRGTPLGSSYVQHDIASDTNQHFKSLRAWCCWTCTRLWRIRRKRIGVGRHVQTIISILIVNRHHQWRCPWWFIMVYRQYQKGINLLISGCLITESIIVESLLNHHPDQTIPRVVSIQTYVLETFCLIAN